MILSTQFCGILRENSGAQRVRRGWMLDAGFWMLEDPDLSGLSLALQQKSGVRSQESGVRIKN